MSYDEVLIDPDVLEESKVHSTIIKRVVEKWKSNSSKAKKRGENDKWVDTEEWEGTRYVITFRNESDLCVVTGFRIAMHSKVHWDTKKK
ncbi:MAG: hypothetical protein JRM73_01900 [Nitrososphaerota archaeon]|nr:hypothetical protein [Nitrososphaerota archaeon]